MKLNNKHKHERKKEKTSTSSNISPELLIGGAEIFIDGIEVGVVSQKHLIGGGVLQHLGDGAQVSPLLGGQLAAGRHLDDVKGIGRHDGRVHVAVIQEVPHDLKQRQPQLFILFCKSHRQKLSRI